MSVRPSIARADGGITVTAPLPCPAAEARCLAVVCAVWARDAIGGDAKILWPNHVVEGDRRVCSVACRATADGDIMFTFRPSPEVDGDRFAQAVAAAAATALAGYPDNRAALIDGYCAHCVTIMKFVDTVYRGVPVYGFAFAVDRHGGLMIMTQESKTVVTIYGGEAQIASPEDAPTPPPLPKMPGS